MGHARPNHRRLVSRQVAHRRAEASPRSPPGQIKVVRRNLIAQDERAAPESRVPGGASKMDELCQRCGVVLSANAEAHVWNGQYIVCASCVQELQHDANRSATAYTFAGRPGAAWFVKDDKREHGPFETAVLIEMLHEGRVDYGWLLWRDGMTSWRKVAQLFTIADLSNGQIELRDHGQGDGTYRPSEFGA
jgi:uncharacterized protein DUF4339